DLTQELNVDDSDSDSTTTSGRAQIHQPYPWSNYSLPQLRELLGQRGQLTTGSRSVLKKRLKNLERVSKSEELGQSATTIDISTQPSSSQHCEATPLVSDSETRKGNQNTVETQEKTHPLRARISSRSNSFSAHFT
ncbi:hypothetical protein BGZ76_006911, partial [Entomortierella beljakovae]